MEQKERFIERRQQPFSRIVVNNFIEGEDYKGKGVYILMRVLFLGPKMTRIFDNKYTL